MPGTWAGKAKWTKAGSHLRRALETAGCRVEAFEWSHSNCHRARTRAAIRLADELETRIKEYPGAQQWIVAHSHGGNIALHAVRRLRESCHDASQVSTVTLATPFIHARQRVVKGWPLFLLALFSFPTIVWAGTTLAGGPSWRDWTLYACALVVVGDVLLCAVGAGMHWGFLRHGYLGWLRRRVAENPVGWWADAIEAVRRGKFFRPSYRSQLIASVHSPKVEPEDVFVIRAAGDEASTGLAVGQFLGWISALFNLLLTNLGLWAGIILVTQVSILFGTMIHRVDLGFSALNHVFATPGLAAAAALSVMLAAAVFFGLDGPFLSIVAFCSTEAAPPGQATILQLEPFAGVENRGLALAHCRLYRNESVISKIVELIRDPPADRGADRTAKKRTKRSKPHRP